MLYKDYLKSEHWKNLRNKKYNRSLKKKKCIICKYDKNLEVHHLSYKKLYDVDTSNLRIYCRGCHSLIHRLIKEGKLPLRHLSDQGKTIKCKHLVKYYKKQLEYKDFWYNKRLGKI